jgi:hypothetical protein
MKPRSEAFWHRATTRHALITLAVIVGVSAGLGIIFSAASTPDVTPGKLFGWSLLGALLFSFPIVMWALLPRQRRRDRL